jgi:hypothetical protein
MTRFVPVFLLVAFSALQFLVSRSAAFSLAPFGISLASVVSRRVNRRISPKNENRAVGPMPSPLQQPPSRSGMDSGLLEFNQLCQQAIDDERRRHYYPTLREISRQTRPLSSSA